MSGDALPFTSNWTSLVRLILRYFKSGFQPRDEFVEQIEILPDHLLHLSEVVSRQTPEYAFPGRDEIQEEFVDLQMARSRLPSGVGRMESASLGDIFERKPAYISQ